MWIKVEEDLPVLDNQVSDLLGNTTIDYSREVLIKTKKGNIVNASLGKEVVTKVRYWGCALIQDAIELEDVVEWCEIPK